MEKEFNVEALLKNLKNYYLSSHEALFKNNDYKTSNKFVKKYVEIEKKLVLTAAGIEAMSLLLDDDNEIIRYYAAGALISIFPKKCMKVLKEIQKSNSFLGMQVKYVLETYSKNNNYIQKYLAEHENTSP